MLRFDIAAESVRRGHKPLQIPFELCGALKHLGATSNRVFAVKMAYRSGGWTPFTKEARYTGSSIRKSEMYRTNSSLAKGLAMGATTTEAGGSNENATTTRVGACPPCSRPCRCASWGIDRSHS